MQNLELEEEEDIEKMEENQHFCFDVGTLTASRLWNEKRSRA
ncbi:hypothetical protein BN1423_1430057 [Carnobacterium maltaromaticum]|nr:conserved hypothetical protein [Carnobacterium maltaromaticum]CAD5897062.1 conserved hypothetical protein [Carnobacterium maltaromaticum]CRH19546.1 hypothetical protein CM318V1_470116 [Carnobacterium maltaromaticum]CRH21240.1 hypothetical protein BN1423_1430057 [Carnobacterium maltaromaticum]